MSFTYRFLCPVSANRCPVIWDLPVLPSDKVQKSGFWLLLVSHLVSLLLQENAIKLSAMIFRSSSSIILFISINDQMKI